MTGRRRSSDRFDLFGDLYHRQLDRLLERDIIIPVETPSACCDSKWFRPVNDLLFEIETLVVPLLNPLERAPRLCNYVEQNGQEQQGSPIGEVCLFD